MSTKTLRKRIALVAVSAMGFGLLSVVPVNAAPGDAPAAVTGSIDILRIDDAAYDDTIGGTGTAVTITATETAANDFETGKVKVGYKSSSTATEILISTVTGTASNSVAAGGSDTVSLATGVRLDLNNVLDGEAGLGTPTSGVYTIGAAGDDDDHTIVLNLGRDAIPGIYTLYVGSAAGAYTSDSIIVAGAPTTLRLFNTGSSTLSSQTIIGDDATNAYDAWVTDGTNFSYLKGTERVSFAVTGGLGTGVTVGTPALKQIGSSDLTSVTGDNKYAVNLVAASAVGTYTLTASAVNWTATAVTATLVTSAAVSQEADFTQLTSPTTQISGSATALAVITPVLDQDAGTATYPTTETVYVNPTQTSFTFRIKSAANAVGTVQYTIAKTDVTTSPAAGTYLATLTQNSTNSYADVTVTTSSLQATSAFTFTTEAGAGTDQVFTVEYKAPVLASIKITPDTTNIAALVGSTTEISATAKDQYGNVVSNAALFLSTADRNGALERAPIATNTSGVASWSITDVSTSTTALFDTITVDNAAGGGAISDSLVINYKTDISAATLTAVSFKEATGNYTGTLLSSGATKVTINGAAGDTATTDQFYMAVTAKNTAGAAIQGLPVVFTIVGGFVAAETDTAAADVALDEGDTTVTVYTDANGVARAAGAVTVVGSVVLTATLGTLSATTTVTAIADTAASSARYVTVSAAKEVISAKVTDGWGNAVAGASVTFSASGGSFLTGSNSTTGTTDSKGVATASLAPATGVTVTASLDDAVYVQMNDLADSPITGWAAGIAEATTAALTVAAVTSSTDTAIAGLLDVIKALEAKIAADKIATDAAIAANAAKAAADTAAAQAAAVAAAEAAADAAAEAIDAGNNAFDAATSAGEAADAATAAAEQAGEDATAAANAAGEAAVAAAEAAQEAAAEATDAANAATDAANASAEAADAATAAAQDAADAVAALSTQVSEMISALKKQITSLTNLVIKIQKKVKA